MGGTCCKSIGSNWSFFAKAKGELVDEGKERVIW
jgi:hypothetical protein